MPDLATVHITRDRGPWWFRVQSFGIELDGALVERIRGGETRTITTPPGRHCVRVKFRMIVRSEEVSEHMEAGDQLRLECGTDRRGYPYLRVVSSGTP